jgi:UDP-N-acetylmuramoyl-L-alanyl-D-glutamate--2,6-diaminopimelate ligase
VRPGMGFIAVPGYRADGHDFIEAALRAGAEAAVVEAGRETKWGAFEGRIPLVVVPDCREAMGSLAAAVHDFPSRKLRVIGITGTDGKTTTSHITAHVLQTCGLEAGYLSSVGFDIGSGFELNESHMTTLEGTLIQSRLAQAVRVGRKTMVLEASSEGLALHRLEGCEVDVAIFTNLTRDHLDFHGTMERYLAAKGLLFEKLAEATAKRFPRIAILNADDASSFQYLRGVAGAAVLTYGIESSADVRGSDVETEPAGLRFNVQVAGDKLAATAPLVGQFNAYNCLAAIATAISQGVVAREAVETLASFPGVPGRLERIDQGQPFRVYIDIASTPAALENVLRALRPVTRGRLWVVFGAAGGRDPARRDGMGRVAGRLADRAVLTNEDPREEDPDEIIAAIASGLEDAGRSEGRDFVRHPDRRMAIAHAFGNARAGDTVLLAGKATETSMLFAGWTEPWDERAVALQLLEKR